jgi:nucleotide-binding universal stress UspA family protein
VINVILAAIDGSEHALHAVDYSADLAVRCNADLIFLHVSQRLGLARIPPELYDLARVEHIEITETEILRRIAESLLESAEHRARSAGATRVRTIHDTGQPAELIVAHAKREKANLIVMGRRGLGSVGGLLMGSVSNKVGHLSECACMTVL